MKRALGVFLFLSLIVASIVGVNASASATSDPEKCYDTVHVDDTFKEVKVIDVEAVPGTDAVAGVWYNWSPNKDQGPFDGPPAFPTDERGTWEGPHDTGGPSKDLVGTFQQGQGNGSWFHREPGTPAVPAVEEVSHIEQVVDVPAHDEKVEVPCDVVKPPEPEAVIELRTSDKVVCDEDRVYIKVESREAIFTYDEVSNTYKQTGWTEWIHILTDERDATDKECPPPVDKPDPKPTTPVEQDTPVNTDRELPDTGGPSGLLLLGGLALAGAGYVIYRKNK